MQRFRPLSRDINKTFKKCLCVTYFKRGASLIRQILCPIYPICVWSAKPQIYIVLQHVQSIFLQDLCLCDKYHVF